MACVENALGAAFVVSESPTWGDQHLAESEDHEHHREGERISRSAS
jgi:hypothetical protein